MIATRHALLVALVVWAFIDFTGDRPVRFDYATREACEAHRAAALAHAAYVRFGPHTETFVSPCVIAAP
jgi:hypothetical protein